MSHLSLLRVQHMKADTDDEDFKSSSRPSAAVLDYDADTDFEDFASTEAGTGRERSPSKEKHIKTEPTETASKTSKKILSVSEGGSPVEEPLLPERDKRGRSILKCALLLLCR